MTVEDARVRMRRWMNTHQSCLEREVHARLWRSFDRLVRLGDMDGLAKWLDVLERSRVT